MATYVITGGKEYAQSTIRVRRDLYDNARALNVNISRVTESALDALVNPGTTPAPRK